MKKAFVETFGPWLHQKTYTSINTNNQTNHKSQDIKRTQLNHKAKTKFNITNKTRLSSTPRHQRRQSDILISQYSNKLELTNSYIANILKHKKYEPHYRNKINIKKYSTYELMDLKHKFGLNEEQKVLKEVWVQIKKQNRRNRYWKSSFGKYT